MKSYKIIVSSFGGPNVLDFIEESVPEPKQNEVLVRVQTAGVAFADLMRRKGVLAPRTPFTPGYDIVGEVVKIGNKVSKKWLGLRVAAMTPRVGLGGYAEHICIPENRLIHVPDHISAVEAICLGLNYITAYQLLHRVAKLKEGSSILVHGAAGGVGTALLELAKLAGLTVFGTASAKKHELVRKLNAEPIDYENEDFVSYLKEKKPDGVDAVFDGIGGSHLRRSYEVLSPRGTLVSYGVSGDVDNGLGRVILGLGVFASLKLSFDRKRVRFYGITVTPGSWPGQCRKDWETLLTKYYEKLHPVLGACIPLQEAVQAHELLEKRAVSGKIVLTCTS